MRRLTIAASYLALCVLTAWAGVNGEAPTTVNGLISFLGLTSGTSGGIPYFSATNTLASSGVLASTALLRGGGAGVAPNSGVCLESAVGGISCSSATASSPSYSLTNTTSDTSSTSIILLKNRSGGDTASGDLLGQLFAYGFANSAQQASGLLRWSQSAALSGANIPTTATIFVSNASALLGITETYDNKGHWGVAGGGTPTVSACGTTPGTPTGTDMAGEVAEGTTATGCTITFANSGYTAAPHCVVALGTQQVAFTYTISTTAITVTNTSATGDVIHWICVGN